tara:strand:+ start:3057 stop:3551 length:495 start_codon:yes stop_codon:yes gene_type:complete
MILHYFNKKENNLKKSSNLIYEDIISNSNNLIKNNLNQQNLNFNLTFEIFSIITVFYLKKLKDSKTNFSEISQIIVDNLISDLDITFREQGIGDMSIGKYVKKFVKKFYFRLKILDDLLNEQNGNNLNFVEYLKKFKILNSIDTKKLSNELALIYKNLNIDKYK